MGCKTKFNAEFSISKMSRNSLVCLDKDYREVYIHRNVYNQLEVATDYRIVEKPELGHQLWIEVLVWKSF